MRGWLTLLGSHAAAAQRNHIVQRTRMLKFEIRIQSRIYVKNALNFLLFYKLTKSAFIYNFINIFLNYKINNLNYKINNLNYKINNLNYKINNLNYKINNLNYKINNLN